MTSTKRRQLLLGLLSLALGYTLFGFFVLPRLLKAVVLWQLPKQIGRPVTLAKIKFNPFTAAIAIDGFAIAEPDGQPFIGWDEVFVNVDPTALLSREVVFAEIAVSNAFGHVEVNKDGSFNFSDILRRFPADGTPQKKTGEPMLMRVGQLWITGSRVRYDDLSHATPFHTTVGPIDVTLRDFSTSATSRNPYGFTAVTEAGEKFSWKGAFNLSPLRSSGDFAINGIKLGKYAPYYDDFVSLTIHDGLLDLRAHYQVELTDRLTVAQVSNLTVHVQSLKIGPRDAATTLLEVPDLILTDTFFDLIGQVIKVGSFSTRGARHEVERLSDGSINLLNLVGRASRPSPPQSSTTNTPPDWSATVRNVNIEDWGFHVTGIFGEQNIHWRALTLDNIQAHTAPISLSIDAITLTEPDVQMVIHTFPTNLAVAAATTNAPAPKTPLPPIQIGSITITNATLTYADKSLQPAAGISLDKLNVSLRGLSSDATTIADLHVTGRVDDQAPIEITGRINPLNMDATTTMQIRVKGIDIVPVGPYSGKYAGYLIRKGKLSLDLNYDIEHRQLKAANKIVVDQFTFGEATSSPDAVKLPVRLGVAILKDRNGQIALDIPVEGRIDDPKFRYGAAVWRVLSNLFTKIFTAPFSMLGSLFGGGGEELSYQTFAPGSAVVVSNETKKLDVLIKALTERPALNLEITGSIDLVKDSEPLKLQKLDALLRELKAKRSGAVGTPRPTGDEVGRAVPSPPLTDTERAACLRELYAEALPRLTPPPPVAPTNFTTNIGNLVQPGKKSQPATGTNARRAAADLSVEEMTRQYLPLIELTEDDYRALANARVASVVAYLKDNGQVTDDRLLISNNPNVPVAKDGARATFGLQ